MAAPPKKATLSKDAEAEVLDAIAEEQESLRGISRRRSVSPATHGSRRFARRCATTA